MVLGLLALLAVIALYLLSCVRVLNEYLEEKEKAALPDAGNTGKEGASNA
jgi:hypothetical protein